MKFGTCPAQEGLGHILAHSVNTGGKKVKKGKILNKEDILLFQSSGVQEIMVARLEEGDLGENEAAELLGRKLTTIEPSLFVSSPFTGRVNFYASQKGLLQFDTRKITEFNLVDEAITLATLPDLSKVEENQLVGTIKIIPYGVARSRVLEASGLLEGVVEFREVLIKQADLIITTPFGEKDKLAKKAIAVTNARLKGLGISLEQVFIELHEARAVGESLGKTSSPLVLVMTSTATSDANDTGPQALILAGGKVNRVGIPVDPGNLLFFGELGTQKIIGLPGCARSPALNGADWVLERIACGVELTPADFAAMGAGGLLKEIPTRSQPRDRRRTGPLKPNVQVILFVDSKDQDIDAQIATIMASQVDGVSIVGNLAKENTVRYPNSGMIRLVNIEGNLGRFHLVNEAMTSIPRKADAVLFIEGRNEEVTSRMINQLISAFSLDDGREICKFGGANAPLGPPILFGRRFFENLRALESGLRPNDLLMEGREYLFELELD